MAPDQLNDARNRNAGPATHTQPSRGYMHKYNLYGVTHEALSRREERTPKASPKRQSDAHPQQPRREWLCDSQKAGRIGETVHNSATHLAPQKRYANGFGINDQ
jgi:hypothetical protein